MKKLMVTAFMLTGMMQASDRGVLGRLWDTAGDVAFYPLGVILDNGPVLIEALADRSPTVKKILDGCDTPLKQEALGAGVASAILVSAIFAAPASLFVTAAPVVTPSPTAADMLTDNIQSSLTYPCPPRGPECPGNVALQPCPGREAFSVVTAPRQPSAPEESSDAHINTIGVLFQSTAIRNILRSY